MNQTDGVIHGEPIFSPPKKLTDISLAMRKLILFSRDFGKLAVRTSIKSFSGSY